MYEEQGNKVLYRGDNKQYGSYDKAFTNFIDGVHARANSGDAYNNIKTIKEKLVHLKNESGQKYLDDLLYPERAYNAKIPNSVPFPTASIRVHNTSTLTTNSTGNVVFCWNPYYLSESSASYCFVNNDATLTGSAANNIFGTIQNGFSSIPALYSEFRLVSASVVVTCRSSQLNMSGVLSGGILIDPSLIFAGGVAQLGNFLNIDDSYYNQIRPAGDGLRMLYFPIDPSFESFTTMGNVKPGFAFCFYGQGLQASTPCIRVDYYANFECTPYANMMQYIPRTFGSFCSEEVRYNAVKEVQKNATNPKKDGKQGDVVLDGVEELTKIVDRVGDIISNNQGSGPIQSVPMSSDMDVQVDGGLRFDPQKVEMAKNKLADAVQRIDYGNSSIRYGSSLINKFK